MRLTFSRAFRTPGLLELSRTRKQARSPPRMKLMIVRTSPNSEEGGIRYTIFVKRLTKNRPIKEKKGKPFLDVGL
jgi:hypothetical protein